MIKRANNCKREEKWVIPVKASSPEEKSENEEYEVGSNPKVIPKECVRLQHRGEVLYLDRLQATTRGVSCSVFVRPMSPPRSPQIFGAELVFSIYGLHNVLPHVVPPGPPSARTTVGITSVLSKRTATPTMRSIRFMVVFSL